MCRIFKKRGILILFFYLLTVVFPNGVCYGQEIKTIAVFDQGLSRIAFENQPFIKDRMLYLPLRELINYFGDARVQYEPPYVTIRYSNSDSYVKMIPNEKVLIANDVPFDMNYPVILQNGYTYISPEYLSRTTTERDFSIEFDLEGDTLSIYLRNTPFSVEQKNWTNKKFNLKELSEKNTNTIVLSDENAENSFRLEFPFTGEKEDLFYDPNGKTHKIRFMTSKNRCGFYREPGVKSISVPFEKDYEMILVECESIDDNIVNRIFQYRDAKWTATELSVPAFSIDNEKGTFLFDQNGFFQEENPVSENTKDGFLPVESDSIEYQFDHPFYFILMDKKADRILYQGWYGYPPENSE